MVDREKLMQLHSQNFSCAQCVAAYFSERVGIEEKTALAATGGFGGGFRSGSICGAASAAVMMLGLSCPHTTPGSQEERKRTTDLTIEYIKRFKERYEYLECRDLKGKGHVPCDELICGAAEIADDMLGGA